MELNERMAAAEALLDTQSERLNRHSERIKSLEAHNIKQDAKLQKLCVLQQKTQEDTEKNTKLLTELMIQGRTIKWLVTSLVTSIPVLISLWVTIKQLGWL